MVFKEMILGGLNGFGLAIITGAGIYLMYGDVMIAGVFAAATIMTMIIAGISGVGLPLLLVKLGQDPAISSGVFPHHAHRYGRLLRLFRPRRLDDRLSRNQLKAFEDVVFVLITGQRIVLQQKHIIGNAFHTLELAIHKGAIFNRQLLMHDRAFHLSTSK